MKPTTKKFLVSNAMSIISLIGVIALSIIGYLFSQQTSSSAQAQSIKELQTEQKSMKEYMLDRKIFRDKEREEIKGELKEIRKEMGTKDEQMHQRRLIEEILRIQKK